MKSLFLTIINALLIFAYRKEFKHGYHEKENRLDRYNAFGLCIGEFCTGTGDC